MQAEIETKASKILRMKKINQDWSDAYAQLEKHYRNSQNQLKTVIEDYEKVSKELQRIKSPQMLDNITKVSFVSDFIWDMIALNFVNSMKKKTKNELKAMFQQKRRQSNPIFMHVTKQMVHPTYGKPKMPMKMNPMSVKISQTNVTIKKILALKYCMIQACRSCSLFQKSQSNSFFFCLLKEGEENVLLLSQGSTSLIEFGSICLFYSVEVYFPKWLFIFMFNYLTFYEIFMIVSILVAMHFFLSCKNQNIMKINILKNIMIYCIYNDTPFLKLVAWPYLHQRKQQVNEMKIWRYYKKAGHVTNAKSLNFLKYIYKIIVYTIKNLEKDNFRHIARPNNC
ncbi:hypothetical protein RFI_17626 [Reticulomyxa filosa]|uniref:Uncharacterized protein n=1 Tax=Reticulomyxa filosa TaxID=46433 RepID=X6MZZ7_RETFI|nr:hypothetical protein RFI_17626 [Reticulomyxa filosa]|eukprot:ETO19605.1 hypothetical protein RFI_17626 [Reticulomyxa filosa]